MFGITGVLFIQSSDLNQSVIIIAALWLEHLLLGSVATAIAILAVAISGAMLFTGKAYVRRGMAMVLGCFLLFGAPVIAAGLCAMLTGVAGGPAAKAQSTAPSPPPAPVSANPFDPYAGAAVPQHR